MSIVLPARTADSVSFSNPGPRTTSRAQPSVLIMAFVAALFLSAAAASADTVATFDLTTIYTANSGPDGTAFGTIVIDTTTGTVEAIDLSFAAEPGTVFPIDTSSDLYGSGPSALVEISETWENALYDEYFFVGIALPVNTLVGYTGGLICAADDPCDGVVESGFQWGISQLLPYSDGQLTPAPEPACLAFLGAGVLCLVEVFRRRSFRGSKPAATVSAR